MKNKKILNICLTVLILTVFAFSLSGCLFFNRTNINDFSDEIFKALFANDALSANFFLENPEKLGINPEASLSVPMSKEDYENNYAAMYTQGTMMAGMFNYNKMDSSQKELFDFIQEFFINNSKFQNFYYFQDNFIGRYMGTQANLPIYLTEYKFRREKDIKDYLILCNEAKTAFPKYAAFEQTRIDNGYGRAKFVLIGALEQCESFSGVEISDVNTDNIDINKIPEKENFVLQNFKYKINNCDFLNENQKQDYIEKATNAINKNLIPAYIQLGIDLKNIIEKTPDNKFNNGGLANFKGGKEYYQVLFNNATGTTISVNEAIVKLTKHLELTAQELQDLSEQIIAKQGKDFNIDKAINDMFANDNWEEEALYDTVETLKSNLAKNFPALPESTGKLVLKQVDESLADHYSPAAFFVSPLDNLNSDESIIINNSGDNNTGYLSYDLLAHEGIPGHLYQYNYAKHSNMNNVVKVLSPVSYKEGWATYVQHYMADFYKTGTLDNLLYKAYLKETLFNGYLRCLIDIWVNYNGYSLEQVNAKIAEIFPDTNGEINAQNIYNACVEVPTNAQTYYFSYLCVSEIKSKLKAKGYSDLEFHKAMLDAPYCFYMICEKYGITI